MQMIARTGVALALALLSPFAALGQTYPAKPIRMIVGFPPAGTTDIVSRIVADRLQAQLGQPVLVDNRPGATGFIGLETLEKSAPDGYTISFLASPTLISGLVAGKEINADRDFEPIGLIYRQGFLISVNPTVAEFKGVKTLQDLIAVVKSNPGKINYGTIGVGSTGHLLAELIAAQAGLKWVFVPYKGAAQLLQETIAGQSPLVHFGGSVDDAENAKGRLLPARCDALCSTRPAR